MNAPSQDRNTQFRPAESSGAIPLSVSHIVVELFPFKSQLYRKSYLYIHPPSEAYYNAMNAPSQDRNTQFRPTESSGAIPLSISHTVVELFPFKSQLYRKSYLYIHPPSEAYYNAMNARSQDRNIQFRPAESSGAIPLSVSLAVVELFPFKVNDIANHISIFTLHMKHITML